MPGIVRLRSSPLADLRADLDTVQEHQPLAHLVVWVTTDGAVHVGHAGDWTLLHAMQVAAESAIERARKEAEGEAG